MDELIIRNWNQRVKDSDTIYMLGDFCFTRRDESLPAWYLNKLQGRKILIKGNHDRRATFRAGWDAVHDSLEIAIDGQPLWLNHYFVWDHERDHPGTWLLYGHVHGRRAPVYVGIDAFGFKPISWPEIKNIMIGLKDQLFSSIK